MSFFKKIFGSGSDDTPNNTNLEDGDIFYTQDSGQYQVYKVLKLEENTLHLKAYVPIEKQPTSNDLGSLSVKIHHLPIDTNGFKKPVVITKTQVSLEDLTGYFEYIKQTGNIDEVVKYAKIFYSEALSLSDQKEHHAAIKKYTGAIDLLPQFYEALDNRAFCYMDLGQWKEAINGFEQSLAVNANNFLAVFSMGECHLNLKEYTKAKSFFERAIEIDPNHPKPKEFLAMTEQLINQ